MEQSFGVSRVGRGRLELPSCEREGADDPAGADRGRCAVFLNPGRGDVWAPPRYQLLLLWLIMTSLAASAAILTRWCRIPAGHVGFWRVFGAALVLAPVWWRTWTRCGRPRVARGAVLTGLCLGLHFTTWVWSLQHTRLANAALFIALQPLMAPWIARPLLGERLNRLELLACLLASVGMFWILGRQVAVEREHLAGTLVALLSAFLCACYFVLSRKYRATQHVLLFTVPVYLVAATVQGLLAVMFTGGIQIGDATTRWALLGLVLLPTVGGHTLAIYLLRHMTSQLITLSVPAQFVLVTGAGALIFGEVPDGRFAIGAAGIVTGVVVGVLAGGPVDATTPECTEAASGQVCGRLSG